LRQEILRAGVAGGFGSVFGTPLAGAAFSLEFVASGRVDIRAIAPALTAAFVGDFITRAWGIRHTVYPLVESLTISPGVALKWLAFAGGVALASTAFVQLSRLLKSRAETYLPRLPVRMGVGGLCLVALFSVAGTSSYLGLGIPTITDAFSNAALAPQTFAWKMLFTAVTLGAGFLGGEVTPLFFVGATLGNLLGRVLGLPLDVSAAVGLAAVFATSARAPIALSIMAVELVGGAIFPHVALVCGAAYWLSGPRGIYSDRAGDGPSKGPEHWRMRLWRVFTRRPQDGPGPRDS
jgi:H+/Cl- antiporter ClcA